MRTTTPFAAWLCATLLSIRSLAQQAPQPGGQQQPGQWQQQPGGQQQPGQWQQQPGQWQQQPGQWQQQPGQWQQQPGQWQQQPGQWQQQPGQWQQQPGQWQQQPGQWQQRPAQPAEREPRSYESSFGLKLLAGGNLWTTPDDIDHPQMPPQEKGKYDALGFAGSGGGFGWGAALYYEARIVQYLGIELDIGYDHSVLQREVTYTVISSSGSITMKVSEKVSSGGLRGGLLFKGIVPTSFGRVWLGLGPELVSPSSVDAENEATEGKEKFADADVAMIENAISAKKNSTTMLTMALGFSIHVGESLEIPIDLRAAKNLSQESDWKDRVDTDQLFVKPMKYEVTVQNSWDFRLGTGLGYRF